MLSKVSLSRIDRAKMGPVAERIRRKLVDAFSPERLEVADDSARHAGHAGATQGGESHFNVTLVSASFSGLGRVERQRRVYAALAEELAGPVHALSLKALAPGE
jgi:BolA protein